MPNTANCGSVVGNLTGVGSYPGSPSPSGTFDQGGHASEWTDGDVSILENRTIRGGHLGSSPDRLRGQILEYDDPWFESNGLGAGTLACNASTCRYNTSGCFDVSCKPKSSRCSNNSECCSGNCRFGRCR